MSDLDFRPMLSADQAFVCDSLYRRCLHRVGGADESGVLRRLVNYTVMTGVVTIAFHPDDPETIMGYAITRSGRLIAVYVKYALRNLPGLDVESELRQYLRAADQRPLL